MWPTIPQPDTSVALAWQTITNTAVAAKADIAALHARTATGVTVAELRNYAPRIKARLQTITDANNVAGLQAYGRTYTGLPLFDLSVEFTALRQALRDVLAAIRALNVLLSADIAADGTVTPARDSATPQECAALATACAALESTIQ